MASQLYKQLERELAELRDALLPDAFDSLGQYPDEQITKTKGYILLSHASFEVYLEAQAKGIAKRAEKIYNEKSKISQPLSFLLLWAEKDPVANLSGMDEICDSVSGLINRRLTEHYKIIRENNGIKESNLIRLFSPLGLPRGIFDTTLLSSLDSFGSNRGEYAHSSSSTLENVPDPKTEFDRVQDLLRDLDAADKGIRSYRQTIR
jgi:hypothetical protein